ncbi:MAG: hypothetical protein R3B70_32330 [Polyangiaceae bacterium]
MTNPMALQAGQVLTTDEYNAAINASQIAARASALRFVGCP